MIEDNKMQVSVGILQRLIDVLAIENQVQLAKALGVSKNMPSTWKERGTIPIKNIMDIAKREKLDLNWILLGAGTPHNEVYKAKKNHAFEVQKEISDIISGIVSDLDMSGIDDLDEQFDAVGGKVAELYRMITSSTDKSKSAKSADFESEDFAYIPRYDIKVSAGPGATPSLEEVKHYMAYRKDWIAQHGIDKKALAVVEVSGDSMEPHLSSGDTVLINTEDKDIHGGSAYVVRIGGDLVVKYLERLPGDVIQVSSANKIYQPYTVELEKVDGEFAVLGRVVNSTRDWR